MNRLRPCWVEIDIGALRRNIRRVKSLIGPGIKLFAVCKGDAYGCGAVQVARIAADEGVYGIAVGNPDEIPAIRSAGVTLPVLLYASTLPEHAAQAADLNVIVTLHDMESIAAFAAVPGGVRAYVKLETGFGRLGLRPGQWKEAFRLLRQTPRIQVQGLYAHFAAPEEPHRISAQNHLFLQACREADAAGLRGFDQMVASSRVLLSRPELHYSSVNPGRLLYGMLEPPWSGYIRTDPVVRAVKSRIIQIEDLPPGGTVGYESARIRPGGARLAVAPIGFGDGLPRLPEGGVALVQGRRVPIVGTRSTEHTVLDVSTVPEARVGSEAVFLGSQGSEEITASELAEATGVPLIELVPRLGRSLPRVYQE